MSTNLMHRTCLVCGAELEELLSCSHAPAYKCVDCNVYYMERTFKAVSKDVAPDYATAYPWRE